jgi:hypoxanthine phosphoribosyltransferase
MADDVGEILIPSDRIAVRVRELGRTLADTYAGREVVVLAVMKGCVLFLADLVRAWGGAMDLEFVTARSYEGTRPGRVRVTLPEGLGEKIAGRPVLVLDDIFDTGRTLAAVCRKVERLRPAEVKALVLLKKRRAAARGARLPDWVGFEIEDRFVVGYGLDHRGRFRNLPFVAALREDAEALPRSPSGFALRATPDKSGRG